MKVLFAAGGSAGHVDPALATARQLDAEILFAGNQSGIEKKLVQRANFQFQHIPKLAFPRSFSLRNLLWPVRAFIVLFKAISISSKVDVIVGFGGYVSAYFYLAGFLLRKPVIAHEANALPGISTKKCICCFDISVNSSNCGKHRGTCFALRKLIYGVSSTLQC